MFVYLCFLYLSFSYSFIKIKNRSVLVLVSPESQDRQVQHDPTFRVHLKIVTLVLKFIFHNAF